MAIDRLEGETRGQYNYRKQQEEKKNRGSSERGIFDSGWTGRLADSFVNAPPVQGFKEAGKIVMKAPGAFDEYIMQPVQAESLAGLKEFNRLNPDESPFKTETAEDINGRFHEPISKEDSDNVKKALSENIEKTLADEVKAAQAMEAEVEAEKPQQTGPVNDPNINATANKVASARDGKDPTVPTGEVEAAGAKTPDEGELYSKAIDKSANDLHSARITPQNWYESKPFYSGLMRFGLGLLSGEDYATAFSHAAKDYGNLSGVEKRESYRDELLADGYREADIMEWVQKGDASILKKPEIKDTYKQFTEKDGSVWQRNLGTNAVTKLKDATKPEGVTYQTFNGKVHVMDKQGNPIKVLGEAGTGKDGKGSGSGSSFGANAQVYMASGGMQDALDNWNQVYQNQTGNGGNYAGAGGWAAARRVLGGDDSTGGRLTNELSPESREAKAAEEGFLQAYGRVLSGGAIKSEEWYSWGDTYFERPGDTESDKVRKRFLRDSMAQLVSDMYTKGAIDLNSMSDEEKANLGMATKARAEAQANRIFNKVTNYIGPSEKFPRGAYVLNDGSFYLPDRGIIGGGSK